MALLVVTACGSDEGGEPSGTAATGGSGLSGSSGQGGAGAGGAAVGGQAGTGGKAGAGAAGKAGAGQGGAGGGGKAGAGGSAAGTGGKAGMGGASGAGQSGAGGAQAGTGGSGGTGGAAAGSGGAGASGGSGQAGQAGAAGRDYTTDRAKFFGQSRCQEAGVLLCEDFESGSWDKDVWSVQGDAPKVDGTEKARGGKALHITRDKATGLSRLAQKKIFPVADNTYYARMFVRFKTIPLQGNGSGYAHWTIAAGTGTGVKGEIRVGGQLSKGKNLFGVGTDGDTGDWTNSDKDPDGKPRAVPVDEWMCLEWLHDGKNDVTRFWWDATEHPSLMTTPTTPHGGDKQGVPYVMPEFTQAWVGWHEYQDIPDGLEMWIDEIAFDGERIGCVL